MRGLLIALGLLLLPCCMAAAGQNWADTAGNDPQYAASKAICTKAKSVKLPDAAGKAESGCNSSDLLYGVGRTADPAAARACAFAEFHADSDDPLTGAGTLATIYANGNGVPRDYDLAIAYACRIDGAPAEVDGWVKDLAQLRDNNSGGKPFDLCDDATSGMLMGACAERSGALADDARSKAVVALTAKLDAPGRTAFEKLQAAERRFSKTSADNEVDTSGSARGAFIVESRQKHHDAFVATLRNMLDGKLPSSTAMTRADEDKKLNDAYMKLMALKDTASLGTVEKKGIRETQRSWLNYRDAFIAFAKIAAPGDGAADDVLATLTEQRTNDFKDLLGT